MVLSLEQELLETLRALPLEKRKEVLDFAEFLARPRHHEPVGDDLYGLWSDLDISISADDLKEARTEMWSDFPKADV